MKNILSVLALMLFLLIAFGSEDSNKNNSYNSNSSSTNSSTDSQRKEPCYGSESCIQKVRENFRNTGKQILSEQYLGQGRFGITFLDPSRGEAYNADVSTDCNCNVSNVHVSVVQ